MKIVLLFCLLPLLIHLELASGQDDLGSVETVAGQVKTVDGQVETVDGQVTTVDGQVKTVETVDEETKELEDGDTEAQLLTDSSVDKGNGWENWDLTEDWGGQIDWYPQDWNYWSLGQGSWIPGGWGQNDYWSGNVIQNNLGSEYVGNGGWQSNNLNFGTQNQNWNQVWGQGYTAWPIWDYENWWRKSWGSNGGPLLEAEYYGNGGTQNNNLNLGTQVQNLNQGWVQGYITRPASSWGSGSWGQTSWPGQWGNYELNNNINYGENQNVNSNEGGTQGYVSQSNWDYDSGWRGW